MILATLLCLVAEPTAESVTVAERRTAEVRQHGTAETEVLVLIAETATGQTPGIAPVGMTPGTVAEEVRLRSATAG